MCQNRFFEIDMCIEQHIVANINTEVLYGVARCYGAAANLCKSVTRDVCKVSSCSNKHTQGWVVLVFNRRPLVWKYNFTLVRVASQLHTNS